MKSLEDFEFTKKSGKGAYNWAKILDGGIYQLNKGEDFECEVSTFGLMCRTNAARQHKNIRITQNVEAGTIVLKAEPMSPAERDANLAKLEKAKAVVAAKRAEKRASGTATPANGTTANGVHPAVSAADAPPAPKPVVAPTKPTNKPLATSKK